MHGHIFFVPTLYERSLIFIAVPAIADSSSGSAKASYAPSWRPLPKTFECAASSASVNALSTGCSGSIKKDAGSGKDQAGHWREQQKDRYMCASRREDYDTEKLHAISLPVSSLHEQAFGRLTTSYQLEVQTKGD